MNIATTNNNIIFQANFTNLEKQLIDEVREYSLAHGTETCRIIKNGKDVTNKFDIYGIENYVSAFPKNGYIFHINLGYLGKYLKFKYYTKNATYIHSHTAELPLSLPDVKMAIMGKLKKIIAVTPSGKDSTLELNKNRKKLLKHIHIFDELIKKNKELEIINKNVFRNPTTLKIYQEAAKRIWDKFVELTGVKYSSNI